VTARDLGPLAGKRLLVVEDEYLIASDLVAALEEARAEVVGPAATVEAALQLVASEDSTLDGAVLDINLRDQRVFPVADALEARGVPFVFATGYDEGSIPPAYRGMPRYEKPVDKQKLLEILARLTGSEGTAS
jgi:DNA-binding NtrC family response regulator